MLTKDEARNVPRALDSVPANARVLVLDAESQDATAAIARARGAAVVERPWSGFVVARRFALARVATPWTFMLDADEALDPALAAALAALEPAHDVDGYSVRRLTYFCGRAIRHGAWGAEAPLRFFRTASATLVAQPASGGEAELHERWSVPGRCERLPGTLQHYSYPTLAAYREKFARYTGIEARGQRAAAAGWRTVLRALLTAALRAPWLLLVRGGWRDGWRGTFIAIASAAYPAVVAWKAWRWQR